MAYGLTIVTWLGSINPVLAGVLTLLGIVVICVPVLRKWHTNKKARERKLDAGMDSLLGYGAIHDPATGAVLKEATPSMAVRVDTIEQAILSLAETHRQLTDLNVRLNTMEEWREHHMAWSESQHPTIVQNIHTEPKS